MFRYSGLIGERGRGLFPGSAAGAERSLALSTKGVDRDPSDSLSEARQHTATEEIVTRSIGDERWDAFVVAVSRRVAESGRDPSAVLYETRRQRKLRAITSSVTPPKFLNYEVAEVALTTTETDRLADGFLEKWTEQCRAEERR
jgi:hypothetical protein